MNPMLSKALREFTTGPLNQLIVNLGGQDGSQWEDELNKFLRKESCWVNGQAAQATQPKPKSTNILRSISAGKDISLDASDGTEFLADQAKLFPGWLDQDFVNYRTNVSESPVSAVKVEVHEMVRSGDFSKIFGSFNVDLDKLRLSQGQIIQFVKKHPEWLHPDGYATLFLFKVGDEFFVVLVGRSVGRLWARVLRFSYVGVWLADGRSRVVVPQLTLES
ncbi:MAG: hypothetical protein WCV82_03165 [Candidatus Paceibacterota bacterium]